MARHTICDKCGKEFDKWDENENFHFYGKLGYGTKYDGSFLELDLCCDCMEEIIDQCKISPIKEYDED